MNIFAEHLPRLEQDPKLVETLQILKEFVRAFTLLDVPDVVKISIEVNELRLNSFQGQGTWDCAVTLSLGTYSTTLVKVSETRLYYSTPNGTTYDLAILSKDELIEGLKKALRHPLVKHKLGVVFTAARSAHV